MVKAQSSLFIFNKDSHLEGIMHYNTTLNNRVNDDETWQLSDSESLDNEDNLDESEEDEEYIIDDLDEDDDDFDYDFDDEDELPEEEDEDL